MWSGKETDKKAANIQARTKRPELWIKMGRNAKLKERQKWSHEKTKLDNARKLRGIYFIDLGDKEFKETIKNARKKSETPMAPAMPCKTSKNSQHGATHGKSNEIKWKLACILEASESTRLRMEESLPNHHEDHIAGIHCSITIWYINLFLCLKPWKFPQRRQQWIKKRKIAYNFGVGPDESQKSKRGDRWSKDEGRKNSFCLTDGHLSFEECRIGGKAPKIQRSSCTPRRHCERWFWILRSIHRARFIIITNDSSKSHGYHIQTARVRRTSSGCSICLYPGKKRKMLQNYWKIPKSECPDIWIRQPRHKWPKSWSSMEDPVVPLERNLYGHPLAGLLWERQLEKIFLQYGWEKVSN